MTSRILPVGLLAAGCLTAAAGGSYLALRHNAAQPAPVVLPAPAPSGPAVNESEGIVTPPAPSDSPQPAEPSLEKAAPPRVTPRPPDPRRVFPKTARARRVPVRASRTTADPSPEEAAPAVDSSSTAAALPALELPPQPIEPPPAPEPAAATKPVFEVIIPSTSVIGLELETTLSSETASVEDRVDARVTRDVYADGRLAIPAGSRVIGAVTVVERGGKVKERARLGVRFHTLVLAGGRQVNLRTEEIYRAGDSPADSSSKKIGGAAVGGAVLGAIIGGKKGALIGATTGAAGGTAAVMAGDRKPATLTSGTVVTVKLAAPATLEVER